MLAYIFYRQVFSKDCKVYAREHAAYVALYDRNYIYFFKQSFKVYVNVREKKKEKKHQQKTAADGRPKSFTGASYVVQRVAKMTLATILIWIKVPWTILSAKQLWF